MNIVDVLKQDEMIQRYRKEFKEKYKRNPPPFNFDEYESIEDYREYLRKLVEGE